MTDYVPVKNEPIFGQPRSDFIIFRASLSYSKDKYFNFVPLNYE